jgi:Ca2+-binding RTX toxin-like protein
MASFTGLNLTVTKASTGIALTTRIDGTTTPITGPIIAHSGPGYDPPVFQTDGTDRADVLHGKDLAEFGAHDEIYGHGGNDMIFGHAGGDWITGGWGADFIDGGEGEHDISLYLDSPEGVEVDLRTGRGTWGTANGDTLVNIEDLAGSSYNDVLIGNGADNNLHGLDGDDRLMGGVGVDKLTGGAGIDTADYSDSGVGVSVNLVAGRGFGGTAEGDTLDGIEDLLGSPFNDSLIGNDAANYFHAGGGDDLLKGGGGADWLEGVGGNDTLKGGGGADTLLGGVGIDTASYDGSGAGVFVSLRDNVAASGDAEGDRLYGIENLSGSINADNLWGDDWANVLNGMVGDDTLKGFGGADTLLGNDGNDWLDGGTGADAMSGGFGGDRFVWNAITDTGFTAATADLITDFNAAQGDRIDVSNVDANIYASGNQAFTFIGTAAFSGAPGEIRYVQAGGETLIQMQTGMDPDVEGVIRLAGLHTPDAGWFSL